MIAAGLDYPPTPDLARRLSLGAPGGGRRPLPRAAPRRIWAYAAIVLALLAAGVLAVPQARASLFEFFRFGAVRFILRERTATSAPTSMPFVPTPTGPALAGRTTFAEAETLANFPILLPAYPEDLGPPDEVYFQQFEGQVVITVWRGPDGHARLALYHLTEQEFVGKAIELVRRTTVNGMEALWVRGPHMVRFEASGIGEMTFVAGNVLIWTDGGVTYRLESDLPLVEAVRIAESLH